MQKFQSFKNFKNFISLKLVVSYRVEVSKTTAVPLVVKFAVKAGGDSNANRAVLLVF